MQNRKLRPTESYVHKKEEFACAARVARVACGARVARVACGGCDE